LVRGIKKGADGEDVYDCLQTGRNGSKSSQPLPSSPFTCQYTNIYVY
jgi:hypothetical protein